MTVVTETFLTPLGGPAPGAVVFTPCSLRQDDDGAGIIVTCPQIYQLVGGVLTTDDLEPGCYVVKIILECRHCPPVREYTVMVPVLGPVELWDLIDEAVVVPAIFNPYVVSVAGLSGEISLAELQVLLPDDDRSYAETVGDGTSGPFLVTHSLGSDDVVVTVRDLVSGFEEVVAWRVVDADTISVEPDIVWALDSRRVYVVRVV